MGQGAMSRSTSAIEDLNQRPWAISGDPQLTNGEEKGTDKIQDSAAGVGHGHVFNGGNDCHCITVSASNKM